MCGCTLSALVVLELSFESIENIGGLLVQSKVGESAPRPAGWSPGSSSCVLNIPPNLHGNEPFMSRVGNGKTKRTK